MTAPTPTCGAPFTAGYGIGLRCARPPHPEDGDMNHSTEPDPPREVDEREALREEVARVQWEHFYGAGTWRAVEQHARERGLFAADAVLPILDRLTADAYERGRSDERSERVPTEADVSVLADAYERGKADARRAEPTDAEVQAGARALAMLDRAGWEHAARAVLTAAREARRTLTE